MKSGYVRRVGGSGWVGRGEEEQEQEQEEEGKEEKGIRHAFNC